MNCGSWVCCARAGTGESVWSVIVSRDAAKQSPAVATKIASSACGLLAMTDEAIRIFPLLNSQCV